MATVDGGRCLAESVAELTGAAFERRHEEVMEWAETELGFDRGFAEQVHALAEEEDLAPVYAFLLIRCGVGVRELEPPSADTDETAAQQAPPGWVGSEGVRLDDIELERRLRATFRRFRTQLATCASPADAVRGLLAEPDVGPVRLR